MKKYIGQITLGQVQAAQRNGADPLDDGTAHVGIRHQNNWHEWEFDREEIGQITDGTPSTCVFLLYQYRVTEMHSGGVSAIKDLAGHAHFLKMFEQAQGYQRPVLLKEAQEQQIHDGAHRIYAAYEFSGLRPDFRLRVYWNQAEF
jgi:hypothetical protein